MQVQERVDRSDRFAEFPGNEPIRSEQDAEAFVGRICFKLGPPMLVGVELEWHVHDRLDPMARPDLQRLSAALHPWLSPTAHAADPLPRGSAVTVEPGGQVEVSTRPAPGLVACIEAATEDARSVEAALAAAGLTMDGTGLDVARPAQRVLFSPRYDAMQAYFDRRGAAGRTMMCSTAAVQPSLDAGTEPEVRDRWHTLHAVGPALLAAFANSPVREGRPTGWLSSRYQAWLQIDPARTCPPPGADPLGAYARFALDAPLLCRRRAGDSWHVPPGIRFRDWLAADGDRPTFDDLAYHLTTLFPPVRAQGHFEVRYLDAQRGDGWIVPLAVTTALLETAAVRARARELTATTAGRWTRAARAGVRDPEFARAGRALLALAADTLDDTSVPGDAVPADAVRNFLDRYTGRGRCPADDILEELR